ncbi:uncharacterized protein SAMN05216338_105817 [Bradyrhizobium sp. Rc2d]|uniref:DUF418 domain-containing protein n=1 Tax=Bradyrhizobium sp. Rc2d TaxID=1855321 RepID=UPI0008923C7B|nr:DUF418 domain-containing protein [Bradyrhizobium sp. Rc2d]SDJ65432.1 uncharacterized protein SAMN05216338_105817 [Bradyrhizobium sp. Rc2d]
MALTEADGARREGGSAALESPIAPADRIIAIDSIRGIALFGVMAINVVTEFRVSIFEQFLPDRTYGSWLDRALHSVLMVAVDLKAFALFSLLFGLGLAIQYDHLAPNPRRTILLVRRLAFLMFVGSVHLILIWNGDILLEYAIAGFIVLPFLTGSTRLLAIAGIVSLVVFIAAPFLPPMASLPPHSWMMQHIAAAARIYSSGDFAEVLTFRIRELPAIFPLHVFVFPRTVGLMLIGAAIWRAGMFRPGVLLFRCLPPTAAIGILLGGALAVLLQNGWLGLNWRMEQSLERLSAILLAGAYGAAIVCAANNAWTQRLVMWAAPIGRMAFTNYLAQSLIFGWFFYGYGLGLFGNLGVAAALAIGTGVYVSQVAFSAFWLRRYSYGPVEWLWRSVMYGAWQPLHLSRLAKVSKGATSNKSL